MDSVNRSDSTFRLRSCLLAAAVLALLCFGIGASHADAAEPSFRIKSFSAFPSNTQAGGHPDVTVQFTFDNHLEPFLDDLCACNDAKDIIVHLPAGLIGNPHAAPRCTAAQFAGSLCPTDSQIGVATPTACLSAGFCVSAPVPLYNLVPGPGQAGLIGFRTWFINTPIYTELTARTNNDYGLDAITPGVQHVLPLRGYAQTIWGVPPDPSHDFQRVPEAKIGLPGSPPASSNSPPLPFTQSPTTCGAELSSELEVIAYNGARATATAPWPATTGCSQLNFNPSLVGKPTTTAADTPSGFDVELTVPQTQSASTPSPSEIRDVSVELPEGMTVNSSAADGKDSCSDADAHFGTLEQAVCPENAKVATLTIHSAVLPDDLPGAVYLGDPKPGNRYRLVLVADGFGVHVKLPGTVSADPQSGRLKVSFNDLPQFPFELFRMHFFGAERGILATPKRCGTYAVKSTFVPWDNELSTQTSNQFFTIDSGPGGTPCPGSTRPFDPSFHAASVGNTGGAYSPFQVRLARSDGDQNLTSFDITTPPGFSAKIAGIPYCPESALASLQNPLLSGLVELASPSCPAASQIGRAVVGAGAGSHQLHIGGKVYLAGPYKGAPLSLASVVPAVSGPYDLGNVAVRTAVRVDPSTAQITALTDSLPQIIEGIPTRIRSVLVDLNRRDFNLNPTNCSRLAVTGDIAGDEGGRSQESVGYQVANCAKLGFDPALSITLKGNSKRRGNPALVAKLDPEPGEANVGRVAVSLPSSEQLDLRHLKTVCSKVQFASERCPENSIYGHARATTPLLEKPLEGLVYLKSTSNPNHDLPDLAVDLRGQVNFLLTGRIDSRDGGIRAIFNAPDVPVSSFTLSMLGGKKGLLINESNNCPSTKRADVRLRGQNGARVNRKTKLTIECGRRR
jgi:hypothetical protein